MIDVKVGEVKPPKKTTIHNNHDAQGQTNYVDWQKYYNDIHYLQVKMDYFYEKNMGYARMNRLLLVIAIILLLIDLLPRIATFFIKLELLSNLFS